MNDENPTQTFEIVLCPGDVTSEISSDASTLSMYSFNTEQFNGICGTNSDEFTCLFADEKNHLREVLPAGRRPFADQRMSSTGDLLPHFCMAPDTKGELAVVDVRDEDVRKIRGFIKSGKAYPVPIAKECVCQSFIEKSVVSKNQLEQLKDLQKKLVGNGDNLYHSIDRDFPVLVWDGPKHVYHADAEYPQNLIRHTPDEEQICSTFLLVNNLVDGTPELIRGHYFSPNFITEMVGNKEVVAVPEHLTVYLKEVLEMKAIGGSRTYQEACVALTDIKRYFPEGKFVEIHHLCQLRKLLHGGRIIY